MELDDLHTGFLGPPRECLRREALSSDLGDRKTEPFARKIYSSFFATGKDARARDVLADNHGLPRRRTCLAPVMLTDRRVLQFGHLKTGFHFVPEGHAIEPQRFFAGLADNSVLVP